MLKSTILFLIAAVMVSCSNNSVEIMPFQNGITSSPVAMYSVKNTYQTYPNKCEVDKDKVELKKEILSNSDILSYNQADYSFAVTAEGYEKVKNLKDAQPFVLTVANEMTLIGYFKPFISAGVCNESVLMNTKENNKIYFFSGNESILSEADKIAKVNTSTLLDAMRTSQRLIQRSN